MEPSIIVRAIHLLSKMNHIDFYAVGAKTYPIQMMTDSFAMAGKSSSVHESMTTQYLQAYNSPRNHLGFSGNFCSVISKRLQMIVLSHPLCYIGVTLMEPLHACGE